MPITLRVQTRLGMARFDVEPNDTLQIVATKLQQQLPDLTQFKLSRDPGHKDYLQPANATVSQLNLRHGDRIFADHSVAETIQDSSPPSAQPLVGQSTGGKVVYEERPATSSTERPVEVVLDDVDILLYKLDGREKLKSARKAGFGDQGIDSMPVEPYDPRLLKEKDVKLMSFHAYLRKLNSIQGGGKFAQLRRHDFGSYGAAGGKAGTANGFGEQAVSMSALPKPMTVTGQKYRHVDRVEIEDRDILDKFLDSWRLTGTMRYGFLYGTYEQDVNVPLGIKAVVKAIYEPPQENASDGVNLIEDPNDAKVEKVAALMGLKRVGWIFLDLEVMKSDSSKFVCSRCKDTYFLRSNECILAAHFQNMYPSPCKECPDGVFGSKFVTVVVTGNEKNELDYVAYQVSQQGMDLEKAEGILEYTNKPDMCRVAVSSQDRYVPAIFYQNTSEFGNNVTHSAGEDSPYFPVDYLVVSVNGPTFPQQSDPLFTNMFPIENRVMSAQNESAIRSHLGSSSNKPFRPTGQLKVLSDFHFIVYLALHHGSWFPMEDNQNGLPALSRAVSSRDGVMASEFMQNPNWLSFCAAIESPGDSAMGSTFSSSEFGTATSRPSTSGGGDRQVAYQKEADQMVMMGFDRAKAIEFLEIAHGNMELAIEMLSTH